MMALIHHITTLDFFQSPERVFSPNIFFFFNLKSILDAIASLNNHFEIFHSQPSLFLLLFNVLGNYLNFYGVRTIFKKLNFL